MSRPGGDPKVAVMTLDVNGPAMPAVGAGVTSVMVILTERGVPRAAQLLDLRDPDAPERLAEARRRVHPLVVPEVADEDLPAMAVVVPTIAQRLEELARCLDSLAALTYPQVEVVVVDNRPRPGDDRLGELVATRGARLVHEPRPGISAARNAGVGVTTAPVVAFTDDDATVDPAWLRRVGARLTLEPDLAAVTGLILPAELATAAQVLFEEYYGGFGAERTFSPVTLTGRVRGRGGGGLRALVTATDREGRVVRTISLYGVGAYGAGANMAFRRGALDALGGFDEALGTGTPSRGGEDLVALMRLLAAGSSVGYEPSAVVWHRHRESLEELEHQLEGYGTGFTAALTALVAGDRRHLGILVRQVPRAARTLFRSSPARQGLDDPAVRALARLERRGYLKGPFAYLRSRARQR